MSSYDLLKVDSRFSRLRDEELDVLYDCVLEAVFVAAPSPSPLLKELAHELEEEIDARDH